MRWSSPPLPPRPRRPRAQKYSGTLARATLGWLLLLLQLTLVLHFTLVPHGAGGAQDGFGFVHIARSAQGLTAASAASRPRALSALPVCAAAAGCANADSCALGFAGLSSVLFASAPLVGLLDQSAPLAVARLAVLTAVRQRLLLQAPKTSPPRA